MIHRRLWTSLLAIVGVAVVGLALNLAFGNTPVLGLDLQGGVSVVLTPTEGATDDDLIVIRDLVRSELENRGIAEPDVRVEGSDIVVDLPGVRDQREALDAADVAGIVTLQPVLQCLATEDDGATTTSTPTGSTTPGASTPTSTATSTTGSTPGTPAGLRAPTTPTTPTTEPVPPTRAADDSSSPTSTPALTPATSVPSSVPTGTPQTEVLPLLGGGTCLVGPPGGTGEVFARNSANVELDQQRGWSVVVSLSGAGEGAWNTLASECFNGLESCPSRQLAIVLDGVVQSAPTVQAPSFQGEVSITGNFAEEEARSLARVLNRGAFPVDVEVRRVETVSPTLGQDSLRAAVIAGLVGIVAVLALLYVFYRRLTLLVALGLCVWGMLIYSIAAIISQTTNYALTLAGVTGIVVSIGITVDSYVIYFERMKDDVVHGRTLRNSAARSFKATWRTILAANLVAFIAAAVLFVLSVGAVRGFALYLGITTICDVIVLYFFTRPAVILLADTGRLDRRDTFGLGLEPS